jgi:hypothetical protein
MRCGSCAIADEAGPVCIGLFAGCLSEFFATVGIAAAIRAPGVFRLATGGWLMYLTSAVTADFALGYHRLTCANGMGDEHPTSRCRTHPPGSPG